MKYQSRNQKKEGDPIKLSENRKQQGKEQQENSPNYTFWYETLRPINIFLPLKKKKRKRRGHYTSIENNEAGLLELSRTRRKTEDRSCKRNKINGIQIHPPHPRDKEDC